MGGLGADAIEGLPSSWITLTLLGGPEAPPRWMQHSPAGRGGVSQTLRGGAIDCLKGGVPIHTSPIYPQEGGIWKP